MKWKHKQTGWEATGIYYQYPSQGAKVRYEVGGMQTSFFLPTEVIEADPNWEEIVDDRWLDFSFTVREFMEGFVMTIDLGARSHDSLVAKMLVDKKFMEKKESE